MCSWGAVALFKNPLLTWESLRQLSVVDFFRAQFDIRPAQNQRKDVNKFVANHSSELLDFTFDSENEDLAKRSFLLLSIPAKKIATALFAEDAFFTKATQVLSSPSVSILAINRLAALFSLLIDRSPSTSGLSKAVGFMLPLLRHIGEPSVFGLFNSLCSGTDARLPLILLDSHFPDFILRELAGNLSTEQTANLFALISASLKNSVLKSSFSNNAFLTHLFAYLDTSDLFVRFHVWQSFSLLWTNATISKLMTLKSDSIFILQNVSSLHMFHVCVCDFLGQAIKFSAASFTPEEKVSLLSISLSLLDAFPNSTNLICAVFRLIRAMVRSSQFLLFVMPCLFPLLIVLAESPVRTSAAAHSAAFMSEVQKSRMASSTVHKFLGANGQYRAFERRFLRWYMNEQGKPYGGPLARYVHMAAPVQSVARKLKVNHDID
jgi:hypothetical protein